MLLTDELGAQHLGRPAEEARLHGRRERRGRAALR